MFGVPIDLHTYLKIVFTVFYGDRSMLTMSDQEKKQLLNLVYLIFKNDVGE